MASFWSQYGIYIAPLLIALADYAVAKLHPSEKVNNLIQWAESLIKGSVKPPSQPPQP